MWKWLPGRDDSVFGNQHSHGMLTIHFYPHIKKLQKKVREGGNFFPQTTFLAFWTETPEYSHPSILLGYQENSSKHVRTCCSISNFHSAMYTTWTELLATYNVCQHFFLSTHAHQMGKETSTRIPSLCYFVITQLAQDAQEHHHRAWTHTNFLLTS